MIPAIASEIPTEIFFEICSGVEIVLGNYPGTLLEIPVGIPTGFTLEISPSFSLDIPSEFALEILFWIYF